MSSGALLVIAGPSGSGKSTLITSLMQAFPRLSFAVSCTTRRPRPGEQDGRDYFFLAADQFRDRAAAGDFIEWEELHGNCYGTLRSELARLWADNRLPLLDVDVKGALSVKRLEPKALLVFIAPPSLQVLEQRLRARGTESDEQVRIRLARVREEMDRAEEFDHCIINDAVERAAEELKNVYQSYIGRIDAS